MGARVEVVPASTLFVSEPNPAWFGNPSNPKGDSRWTNANWLKSRFHFSFAEYHDRSRNSFGVLRVMNDDLVQPNRGFGTHPHANMEICTYVVSGKLTHKDSMGTEETLSRGSIQFMTAGTGVRHSEHNKNKHNPLRFIQMWIVPRASDLPPNYGSAVGDRKARHNKLAHLVADVEDEDAPEDVPVRINQDANIFVSELDAEKSVSFDLRADRQAYLICLEGTLHVSAPHVDGSDGKPTELRAHDAAKLYGQDTFTFTAPPDSPSTTHFLFVEMKRQ
ncbi:pirin [Salpingoeca rosetta]|uniref:Pirin n=1 Tax=Salpingoeca rosetta (strain ATCC 50818 / BSB-021) TaxID=946362 RepID=F2UGD3_SALR5|nr:pirin [Salpingoeca rosetta]EGD75683.1 pirin [Salpingoeca rosetta]|eukprot:XP_004991604.1 pirin [Salpingoeca rosetta]